LAGDFDLRTVDFSLKKAGSNFGIRLVFLLNPDAWVEGDCIKELVRTATENPKIDVVGCKVYYPNGLLQSGGEKEWSTEGGMERDRVRQGIKTVRDGHLH
jgi:GT2 family glycosyltransferase